MDQQKVKQLLARYYKGDTTLEEENYLREQGMLNQLDDEDNLLTQFFQNQKQVVPDKDFSEALSGRLHSAVILSFRKRIYSAVAAVLIIGITIPILISKHNSTNIHTISDQQLAYKHTKETLGLVSRYLNKGTEELAQIGYFDNGLDYLKYLNMVDNVEQQNKHKRDENNQ